MTKTRGGQTGKRISLRKSIDLKCKDCVYDHTEPGTWRQQIEHCTVTLCPLWEVRTKSSSSAEKSSV